MKVNKLKTAVILAILVTGGVLLYSKASNTATAKLEPKKAVSVQKEISLDNSKWYKVAFSNASEKLQVKLKEIPLNEKADKANKDKYYSLTSLAIAEKNMWIQGFAKEKIADIEKTDSAYLFAGNSFMEHSALNSDSEAKMFLLAKAKQTFKKAVDVNPNNILANNSLAVAIIQLGQDPPMVGIGYIKKSLAIDSNDFSSNYLYGQMLIMSTQYKKAIKVYNKLVALQPSNAGLLFTLSDIYGKTGNQAKAKEFLEKAKTLNNK